MGLDKEYKFKSKNIAYSTPLSLFNPLNEEFKFDLDVCADKMNYKCKNYFTEQDNALSKDWRGNCWMNPPYDRNLNKWVRKAREETIKFGGTKVCLIPVRSNTKWWNEVINDGEVRFIIGEVNFNNEPRGLWLPLCLVIFGEMASVGTFKTLVYTNKIKNKR
jgi:phage N-6-adenine-methyltransferase